LIANKNNLEFLLNHENYDISFLSEVFSHAGPQNRRKILHFHIIEKTRQDGYVGVALVLQNGITFQQLPFASEADILIVQTKNLVTNITLVLVYSLQCQMHSSKMYGEG